jgi:hypothetical protein
MRTRTISRADKFHKIINFISCFKIRMSCACFTINFLMNQLLDLYNVMHAYENIPCPALIPSLTLNNRSNLLGTNILLGYGADVVNNAYRLIVTLIFATRATYVV